MIESPSFKNIPGEQTPVQEPSPQIFGKETLIKEAAAKETPVETQIPQVSDAGKTDETVQVGQVKRYMTMVSPKSEHGLSKSAETAQ